MLDGSKCQFLVPHPFLVAFSFLCHWSHQSPASPQQEQLLAPSPGLAPPRSQRQLWPSSPTVSYRQ